MEIPLTALAVSFYFITNAPLVALRLYVSRSRLSMPCVALIGFSHSYIIREFFNNSSPKRVIPLGVYTRLPSINVLSLVMLFFFVRRPVFLI